MGLRRGEGKERGAINCTLDSNSSGIFTSFRIQKSQEGLGVAWWSRSKAPLVAQLIKNPLTVQETWVRSLDPEDPLQKEMATHSSVLAWEIPRTEEPGRLQSTGFQESDGT